MNKLFIVITDFNGYTQTRQCLKALYASSCLEFTIVLVDHGTSGETQRSVEREFPNVRRIQASPELWWAGATNEGVRFAIGAGAELVMLLNNDCYLQPDAIASLIELHGTDPDAIIAPVQRDLQTREFISISPRCRLFIGFPAWRGPKLLSASMKAQPLLDVEIIGGGRGVLIPRRVFDLVGLLRDEVFPHYWADHDFYLRASKWNIRLCTATGVVVDIDNSRTTMAEQPGRLRWSEFLQSLRSVRSHRNLKDVTSLFRTHYPLPHFYGIGIALYIGRYCLVYACKRAVFLAENVLRRN